MADWGIQYTNGLFLINTPYMSGLYRLRGSHNEWRAVTPNGPRSGRVAVLRAITLRHSKRTLFALDLIDIRASMKHNDDRFITPIEEATLGGRRVTLLGLYPKPRSLVDAI